MKKIVLSLAVFCLSAIAPYAAAQNPATATSFPTKPVTIVVPFSAGGASDIMARLFAQHLAEIWNISVIVENKPGASGTLGGEYVRRSRPDGYTLLMAGPSSMTALAAVNPKMIPYDPLTDFAPAGVAVSFPSLLAVNPEIGAKTLSEFIELLKANPGKYTYSSSGTGTTSHLFAELFKSMVGVDVLHIPYPGSGPGLNAVVAGHVTMSIDPFNLVVPLAKGGRVMALGITGEKRSQDLPEVPAIGEVVKGFAVESFIGLFAAPGTPPDVLEKIADDLRTVVNSPELAKRLNDMGLTPVGSTPQELAQTVATDLDRWQQVVKVANITSN